MIWDSGDRLPSRRSARDRLASRATPMTRHGTFTPRLEDLSARGAERFTADVGGQTRAEFAASWMRQAVLERNWTWFNLQTSTTLKALYGKGIPG